MVIYQISFKIKFYTILEDLYKKLILILKSFKISFIFIEYSNIFL